MVIYGGIMNELKNTRLILKTLGDDTRLRIVNLLHKQEMNVAELYQVINSTQSNISKHLAKLRLTGIVNDRRDGQFIYYHLANSDNQFHQDLINCIIRGLSKSEIFEQDLEKLKELNKQK